MNCPISYIGCEFLGIEVWSPMKGNEVWSWLFFDPNYERWNYLDDNYAIANLLWFWWHDFVNHNPRHMYWLWIMFAWYRMIVMWLNVVSQEYNEGLSKRFNHLLLWLKWKDSSHFWSPMSFYDKRFSLWSIRD